PAPCSTLFPYTTLFRSDGQGFWIGACHVGNPASSFPRRRESMPADCPVISGHKSLQRGLPSWINRSFQLRFHFLICFSRNIALSIVGCSSYQTSVAMPYRFVKPSTTCSRCCHVRPTRSLVTPVYRVPLRSLARR